MLRTGDRIVDRFPKNKIRSYKDEGVRFISPLLDASNFNSNPKGLWVKPPENKDIYGTIFALWHKLITKKEKKALFVKMFVSITKFSPENECDFIYV